MSVLRMPGPTRRQRRSTVPFLLILFWLNGNSLAAVSANDNALIPTAAAANAAVANPNVNADSSSGSLETTSNNNGDSDSSAMLDIESEERTYLYIRNTIVHMYT